METLFTWLHLSDLHVRRPRGAGRRALDVLADDLAGRGGDPIDAILVTGDIGWTGHPEEYEEADALLASVAGAAGLGRERVFVVPGNHDVDRAADRSPLTAKLLSQLRQGRRRLDAALEHARAREVLGMRLRPFARFAAAFGPLRGGAPSEDRLFWSHRVEGRSGARVRLVGLCTAFLAAGEADRGALRIGERQLADAAGTVERGELVIALGHHPARGGWLADEREADAWLRAHAHVHLSGHPHDPIADEARRGVGAPFVWIAAGAAPARRRDGGARRLGYARASLVRRDDGTLAVRVAPRRWSFEDDRFVSDDQASSSREIALDRALQPPEPQRGATEVHGARAEEGRLLAEVRALVDAGSWDAIEARWSEILGAIDHCLARGDATSAWEILEVIRAGMERRDHADLVAAAARRILAKAPEDGPIAAAARASLGLAELARGDLAEAHKNLGEALFLAEASELRETEALARSGLGQVMAARGELDKAALHHLHAATLHDEQGKRRELARELCAAGLAARKAGDIGEAISRLERAHAVFDELSDLRGRAEALAGLGLCLRDAGDIDAALDRFRRALALEERLGDRAGQAMILGNLGNAHRALGELGKATVDLERALAIYMELGLAEGQGAALANLGACHRALGDAPRARAYYERALDVLRRIGLGDDHPHVRAVLAGLGRVSAANGMARERERQPRDRS